MQVYTRCLRTCRYDEGWSVDKHISEYPKRIVGRSGGSMSADNSWVDCRGRLYRNSFYDANGNQRGSSRARSPVCVENLSCFCRIVLLFTQYPSDSVSQINTTLRKASLARVIPSYDNFIMKTANRAQRVVSVELNTCYINCLTNELCTHTFSQESDLTSYSEFHQKQPSDCDYTCS